MGQIADRLEGNRFSSVIISGDIANQNNEKGYSQLAGFLASFKGCLPDDPRSFVVVPGNHDVAWRTAPGTPERYENFIKYIRDEMGATTPPLEGIDNLADNGRRLTDKHYFVNKDEQWAILPLNSSDYCGTWAGLYDIDDKEYEEFVAQAVKQKLPQAEKILDRLDRFRSYDMARVSPRQLNAFQTQAADVVKDLGSGERHPLLIATLHHQLLPVAAEEEIKPFEALTNLGQVRAVLAQQKINIVLHGHKHVAATYWDREEKGGSQASHECLVISGPTVCGEPYTSEVGRSPCSIIQVDAIPGGHRVNVRTAREFLSSNDGFCTRFFAGKRFEPPVPGAGVGVLSAKTFDDAYALLQTLTIFQKDGPRTENNVVVRIEDASSVSEGPPNTYPDDVVEDPGELRLWFTNIAEWWQRPISELSPDLYFTHGSRIRRYKNAEDQFHYAYHAIRSASDSDETNGRAIICLIDPEADFQTKRKRAAGWFPAFASVQFYVTRTRSGERDLNVIGYYRKQEMRYWWPINIRELRLLLDEMARPNFNIGSITTVAAVAVAGVGKPKVAIPLIDRWYDEDKAKIADLVQGFIHRLQKLRSPQEPGEVLERSKDLKCWREILSDVVPPEPEKVGLDNIPIVTRGLELAIVLLKSHQAYEPDERLAALIRHLEQLHRRHEDLRGRSSGLTADGDKEQYRRTWDEINSEAEGASIIIESVIGGQ